MAAPQNLQLAINLLSNKRFCSKLHCYQNHKFNIEANGKVKIDTIVTNLKLKPHVQTCCQLLKTGRTIIFHNEIFQIKNGYLILKNPTLPTNMTILDLHNSNVDKFTRNTLSSDF